MQKKKLNKNICYIFQDQYPWDVRVEKITDTLADSGYIVHIVSRNRDRLALKEQYKKNILIHRISDSPSRVKRNIKNFPAFFSPFWIRKIIETVRENSIDLIMVRDLPLSPAAYLVSKITRKPVIMDMAENYPALIKSTWRFRGPSFSDVFIRNPYLLASMEKQILPLLDGIITVSELSAERVRKLRNKMDQTWVVSNTVQLEMHNVDSAKHHLTWSLRDKSSLILLYVGFIESHRGLEIPIKSLPDLIQIFPDLVLVIVGSGSYKKNLEQLATKLGINKNVTFTGWVPHREIPSLIKLSDICLIPHFVTDHTDTTFPNKIFDYMAQKKPVVATKSRALMEIIQSTNCGLLYEDKSLLSFGQAIRDLSDISVRKALGLNGWHAIQETYNWDKDKEKLLRAVGHFLI